MKSAFLAIGVSLILMAPALGCTIRYSQSLAGSLKRVTTMPVKNSDGGIAVGVQPRVGVISFSEPDSAGELLSIPCEVAVSEVDYRGTFYTVYITAVFPEVETISYCVEEEP